MGGDFWVAIFSESSKWVAIFRFFDFSKYDFYKHDFSILRSTIFCSNIFNPIFTFLNTTFYKKHFSKIIRVHKNLVK